MEDLVLLVGDPLLVQIRVPDLAVVILVVEAPQEIGDGLVISIGSSNWSLLSS